MSAGFAFTAAAPVFDHRSVARVDTDRPAYYGRCLVNHMKHKLEATWNEAASTGRLVFNRDGPVVGVADLTCEDGELVLTLSASAQELPRLEDVAGRHLARFGYEDGLVVSWTRDDGSAGSTQGPLSREDLDRLRAEYEEREARAAEFDAAEDFPDLRG
ncbi:DUF2218 domain-containing protein [Actinomyces ruminicola]|uniref:DUF2218 domain-containing protein n=1 Tax=Actinomyces ruminicola TaxID=332524 RepID=A0A1G9V704_9ACTO|nr:DUF2218 domain-containing protein [Actinomyces ruminicola]SDM67934.1 hypothetical protein SAMN04487766_105128 [Actinomyces ruminicola]